MNKVFNFQKNAKPSFEKKEECLNQIEMPNFVRKSEQIVDEQPTGYEDSKWIEKIKHIKLFSKNRHENPSTLS